MKNVLEIIKLRRSVFPASYTGGEIKPEDLAEILDAARWAPNHKKTEPWRYRVLQGSALTRLGNFMMSEFERSEQKKPTLKIRKLAEKMQQASTIILIFMNRDEKESVPEWEEIAATSMSVQNMWLATSALGYGAYWSSPKSFADMSNLDELQVQDSERFLGFFFLGTIDDSGMEQPERLPVNEIARFLS